MWGRELGANEGGEHAEKPPTLMGMVREALLNGPVFLIVGSLVVGFVVHQDAVAKLKPFTGDIFYGVLVLFLLDMGIMAAKRARELVSQGLVLVVFAIVMPLIGAACAAVLSYFLSLPVGDSFLMIVLAASASYIAAPAAVRVAIPQANPGLHLPMALAVTFPFNIVVGLPFYLHVAKWVAA
ncbi:MAG: sodium-dependent bicarbonate transport family permease [Planctomycetes bacterium]|nr:sodium-dependent bicarbonate transport family permease [Planctomycetota bacterium]